MEQLQLGECGFQRNVQEVLHRIRTSCELLWFPHDDQRVFVRWTPRPQDSADSDTESKQTTLC